MSNIPINLGDAFLIDTPPHGQHLYIAIAKTVNNKYLFVNVILSQICLTLLLNRGIGFL